MSYDLADLSTARLWKYQPDFRSGVELRRSFLTDIIRSRSNHEQRRALRDVARLSMQYRTIVADDDLQAAKHFLRAWQNKPTAIPDFSRWIASTGASIATDTTLTIAGLPAWIAAGQRLALCKAGTIELVTIDSIADPTVTLTDPLANDWPEGSIVRPALVGLLDGRLQGSRITRGTHAIGVALSVYPGGEPPEDEGAADVTFNGRDVFNVEPDFSRPLALDHIWPIELVDFSYGRTAQFRPITRQEQIIEAQFTGLSVAAAAAVEQQFLRCKGSRGSFYRPSCEKDMTLAADTTGTAYFNAAGSDLVTDFGAVDFTANDVSIEIVMINGTRYHKRITGITASGGNSRLAFAGALTLTTETVARISWMPIVRFASDELGTIWQSPIAASITASFQTVKA